MVDIATQKLAGEAKDFQQGGGFHQTASILASDKYDVSENSDLVVITAGVAQKPGESRLSLVERNAKIMKMIMPEVLKYSPNATILVVSNPCDIMTAIAAKIAGPNYPQGKIFGAGTNLDTSRFQMLMASSMDLVRTHGKMQFTSARISGAFTTALFIPRLMELPIRFHLFLTMLHIYAFMHYRTHAMSMDTSLENTEIPPSPCGPRFVLEHCLFWILVSNPMTPSKPSTRLSLTRRMTSLTSRDTPTGKFLSKSQAAKQLLARVYPSQFDCMIPHLDSSRQQQSPFARLSDYTTAMRLKYNTGPLECPLLF
jgi:lactate/malate dehydrogenase, NAD binding domain